MSRPATPSHPQRVFVIEDDGAVRDALLMVLGAAGFAADGFEDGQCFLNEVQLHDDDVLVLDLDMPRLDGLGVAAALKKRRCNPKIVVISGLRQKAFERSVATIAPAGALRKPIDTDALLAALGTAA